MLLTKEQCLSEELNPQSSAINLEDVHLRDAVFYGMQLFADSEVKSNNRALINIILAATNTTELLDQDLTIGELEDIIKRYAKETALAFLAWVGQTNIKNQYLFELFLQSINQK